MEGNNNWNHEAVGGEGGDLFPLFDSLVRLCCSEIYWALLAFSHISTRTEQLWLTSFSTTSLTSPGLVCGGANQLISCSAAGCMRPLVLGVGTPGQPPPRPVAAGLSSRELQAKAEAALSAGSAAAQRFNGRRAARSCVLSVRRDHKELI